MKLFPAILLSGLLALTLAGCTAQSTSGGVSAAASALDATANASPIQIKLNRVKDEIKAEDGHVLVSYAYDRPTVMISGNSAAQSAIQSSLNALVDKDLTYVKGDLYAIAQGNYQALGKDATPCTSELNLTVTRSDDTVIRPGGLMRSRTPRRHGSDWLQRLELRHGDRSAADLPRPGQRVPRKGHRAGVRAGRVGGGLSLRWLSGKPEPRGAGRYRERPRVCTALTPPSLPTFYMTDESITFISREYELQPYAMGVLEFPTPYSDYGSILKEHYLPKGYTAKESVKQDADLPPARTMAILPATTPLRTPTGKPWPNRESSREKAGR